MKSKINTPEEYIASLPEDKKMAITEMRKVILDNLPAGFKEGMAFDMIGYVVPHSIYPPGYHANPKLPLGLISLASQKNHISLHHMALYEGELLVWFKKRWDEVSTKKLDMGKCCIRFKKTEDIPIQLIGELCAKLTPEKWVEIYEKALKRRS